MSRFGNGQEESDANHAGPNLETDGWGLVLWGAAMYLHYSCDLDWLNQTTVYGDTVFEGLYHIARDIDGMIEPSTGLPKAEASIWEVHWDLRQTFTYTAAAQARGLYDFAQIAFAAGREDLANEYWAKAERMHQAILDELVYRPLNSLASHRGVANQDVHVDGSTVEALHWGLVTPDNPVFTGTLSQYDRLRTNYGGYRRLEPSLSLTGESGANEYDLSEWILLDLRIGDMWRLVGNLARADERSTRSPQTPSPTITSSQSSMSQTAVNTLVSSMVGYGAARLAAQPALSNVLPPTFGVGFEACADRVVPGGTEMGGVEMGGAEIGGAETGGAEAAGTSAPTGMGGNSFTPGTGGSSSSFMPNTNQGEGESEFDWESESKASLCSAKTGALPKSLFLFWLIFGGLIFSRRLRALAA